MEDVVTGIETTGNVHIKTKPEDEDEVLVVPTFPFPFSAQLVFRPNAPPPERQYLPALSNRHPVPAPAEGSPVLAKPVESREPTPAPVPRARDADGKRFQTACFAWQYINHPHHHRLICGHDVMTNGVDTCGSNCLLDRTAEAKVPNRPFVCPDPDCKAKLKVFLPERKRGQFVRTGGRPCVLSHVYGLDRVRDEARETEKKAKGGKRKGRKSTRKRSESPPARGLADRMGSRKERPRVADTADAEAAALVQDHGILNMMRSMDSDHTRRLRGNRLETMEEGQFERMTTRAASKLKGLNVDGQSTAGIPAFKEQRNLASEKDSADTIQDGYYPDQFDDAETFCVCHTTEPEFLVLCERCDKGFHPGCIGEGMLGVQQYEDGKPDRDTLFESDFKDRMEMGHTELFHCPNCKAAVAAALKRFRRGTSQHAAAGAREEDDLEDDAIEAMMPTYDQVLAEGMDNAAHTSPRGTKRKMGSVELDDEMDGDDVKMCASPRSKRKGNCRNPH